MYPKYNKNGMNPLKTAVYLSITFVSDIYPKVTSSSLKP